MKLSDAYDVREIFHPNMYYEGDWFLTRDGEIRADHFYLNSKVENGKNKYKEFLDENYYRPMLEILRMSPLVEHMKPRIILTDLYSETGRGAYFSYLFMLISIIRDFEDEKMNDILSELTDQADVYAFAEKVRELFRIERKELADVIEKGNKSAFFHKHLTAHKLYSERSGYVPFDVFINARINGSTKVIMGFRYYDNIFSKEIKADNLIDCFEYDKFCLCSAFSILEACYETEASIGKIDQCICHVYRYIKAVEMIREETPGYNCQIIDLDHRGKKRTLTFDDFNAKFKELLSRHPNFKLVEYSVEQASKIVKSFVGLEKKDFSTKENFELVAKAMEMLNESRELTASWEFLPNNEKEDAVKVNRDVGSAGNISISLPEEEKVRRMVIGKNHLDSTIYLYSLKGINAFAGYIGYIYSNGNVIFEKYYEDEACTKVASSNATYVMNLYKFIELSKMSKTDIIQKIKYEGTTDVKRIYHSSDMEGWKSRVNKAIIGNEYSEEVLDYINVLLGEEIVKRKEKKI